MYAFCIIKAFLIRLCRLIIYNKSNIDAYLTTLKYMHVYYPIILILSCYSSFDIIYLVKYLIACTVIYDFSAIINYIISSTKMNMMVVSTSNPDDSPKMLNPLESPIRMYTYGVESLNSNDPQVRLDPIDSTTVINKTPIKWELLNNSYDQLVKNIDNGTMARRDALRLFETSIDVINNRGELKFLHLSAIK